MIWEEHGRGRVIKEFSKINIINIARSGNRYSGQTEFIKNESFINGLTDYELKMKTNFSIEDASMVRVNKESENTTRVNFTNLFKPGSVIAIK